MGEGWIWLDGDVCHICRPTRGDCDSNWIFYGGSDLVLASMQIIRVHIRPWSGAFSLHTVQYCHQQRSGGDRWRACFCRCVCILHSGGRAVGDSQRCCTRTATCTHRSHYCSFSCCIFYRPHLVLLRFRLYVHSNSVVLSWPVYEL